jgi:hypothetical protein
MLLSPTESLMQMPLFSEPQDEEDLDYSIGERTMASKLLDDTTDELHPAPSKRPSQLPRNKTYSNLAQFAQSDKNKSLPQLPDFKWNGDSAWSMMNAPVVAVDANANREHFHNDEVSNTSAPPTEHSQGSPPPIPPKSSKRKSVQPKTSHGKVQKGNQTVRKSIVHPKPAETIDIPTPTKYADEDSIAEAMQTATSNLKASTKRGIKNPDPSNFRHVTHIAADVEKDTVLESMRPTARDPNGTDQTLLHGPYVSTKEKGFKGSKVFAKMKNALQGSNSRSRHDSGMTRRLLDPFDGESHERDEMDPMDTGLSKGERATPPFTTCTNCRRQRLDEARRIQTHGSQSHQAQACPRPWKVLEEPV